MQRISDTWCSHFGSTAISILNTFFDSEDIAEEFTTNESHQAFAQNVLENFAFLYSDTALANPKVCNLNKYDTTCYYCSLEVEWPLLWSLHDLSICCSLLRNEGGTQSQSLK
jgi:hypothetical protein